jgi:preprotein translocase subunit YajC
VSVLSQILLAQQAGAEAPSPWVNIAPLLIVVGVFYFLMIRPQQKQAREHKSMLTALKKGDEVVTNGGIVGKIYAVTDKMLTLEVTKDVRLRVLKSAVQSRHVEAVEEGAEAGKDSDQRTSSSSQKEKKQEGR